MRTHHDQRCGIVHAPDALRESAQGFHELASIVAVTLGPNRGPVWHADGNRIERLSDSGTIVRRIVEVPGRLRNTGAMHLRHLVWRMHETYGDGGATAAVIASAMVARASALIASGIDPTVLRRGMEASMPVVVDALEAQRLPSDSRLVEKSIAASLSDPSIASVLAEMTEVLGSERAIHLEVMAQPYLDREYVDGSYWKLQESSRAALAPGSKELVLDRPYVLVVDDEVLEAEDLVRLFEAIAREGRRPLVIVGGKLTSEAQSLMDINVARGVLAAHRISPAGVGHERQQTLADVALLTGAELISTLRGRSASSLRIEWLGTARKIALRQNGVLVREGGGEQSRVQHTIRETRRQLASLSPDANLKHLRERLASLLGGAGVLRIGGLTQAERDDQRRQVERVLRVLPELVEAGSVRGGGMAFLACLSALEGHCASVAGAELRFGADIVTFGLQAPFLQLVENSGASVPAVMLHRVLETNHQQAFDASVGAMVPTDGFAVSDSLAVMRGAVRIATSAVIELITTGVILLPKESQRVVCTQP